MFNRYARDFKIAKDRYMKKMFILYILLIILPVNAQNIVGDNDSIVFVGNAIPYRFNYRQLIIPGTLITYGATGLATDWVKKVNRNLRSRLKADVSNQVTIDDFTRFAPAVSVYALNALGIEGRNNFKDRTLILATSALFVTITVSGLKNIAKVQRPDGTTHDSFPSGHTTVAFAGAEFLWQEYKEVSVWYGIAGYAVATGTGIFRLYNDRHWLTDIAAGAGIGILSTKAAYWLNPFIKRKLFGTKENKIGFVAAPFYNGKQSGCSIIIQF